MNFSDGYLDKSWNEFINGVVDEPTKDCNKIPEQKIPVKIDDTPMMSITMFSDRLCTDWAEVVPNDMPIVLKGM